MEQPWRDLLQHAFHLFSCFIHPRCLWLCDVRCVFVWETCASRSRRLLPLGQSCAKQINVEFVRSLLLLGVGRRGGGSPCKTPCTIMMSFKFGHALKIAAVLATGRSGKRKKDKKGSGAFILLMTGHGGVNMSALVPQHVDFSFQRLTRVKGEQLVQ